MAKLDVSVSFENSNAITRTLNRLRGIPQALAQGAKLAIFDSKSRLLRSVDVNNAPFPPLKSGEPRRPVLKTYRLFNSFEAIPSDGGFSVTVLNQAPYSSFQNAMRTFMSAQRVETIMLARINKDVIPE